MYSFYYTGSTISKTAKGGHSVQKYQHRYHVPPTHTWKYVIRRKDSRCVNLISLLTSTTHFTVLSFVLYCNNALSTEILQHLCAHTIHAHDELIYITVYSHWLCMFHCSYKYIWLHIHVHRHLKSIYI